MAETKKAPKKDQAVKRIRQADKRRQRRKSLRNEIKTITKRVEEFIESKEFDQARVLLKKAFSKLDKAKKSRVYHPNSADRRKSKLAREINAAAASGQEVSSS
jgi:small subunit ribosomal protein S20